MMKKMLSMLLGVPPVRTEKSKADQLVDHREGLNGALEMSGCIYNQLQPWEQKLVDARGENLKRLIETLADDPTVVV